MASSVKKEVLTFFFIFFLCISAKGDSLFDDIDFTISAPDATNENSQKGSSHGESSESKESLFGGPRMSYSLRDLGEEESDSLFHAEKEISYTPESDLVLERPKPVKNILPRSRTASATLSTSFGQTNEEGSLFDEVPNAGANMADDKIRQRRLSLIPLYDFSSDTSNGYSQDTSLFDLVSLYPRLDEASGGYDFSDTFSSHRFSPQFQVDSEEDLDDVSTSETLALLAQSAKQLADALGTKPRFQHESGTYPHDIQGDIQAALEKLASRNSGTSDLFENPESSYENQRESLFTENDFSELSKLFDGLRDESQEKETYTFGHDSIDKESLSEIRQQRLEDLRLALEIVKAFERPITSDSKIDKRDEKFELMLARAVFNRNINSLRDLNLRQRNTLQSLTNIVLGSHSRSVNTNLTPPARDVGSPAPPDNSYLLPARSPPAQDVGSPAPPDTSYLLPNRNTPAQNPSSGAASISVIPVQTYRLPTVNTVVQSNPPQQNPSNTYLLPAADPTPQQNPSNSYLLPAADPTPQQNPSNSYLLPAADPTPTQAPLPASTFYLLPAPPTQQADVLPPAPPPTVPPRPPPPPPPPSTTSTTTSRPERKYLPPSNDVRPLNPAYQAPRITLPLESNDDDSSEWRPLNNPSRQGSYTNDPSDTTRNVTDGNIHYYHYHYHISGSKDELFNQNNDRQPLNDDSLECGLGIPCNDQSSQNSVTESSYASLGDEVIVGRRPSRQFAQQSNPSLNYEFRPPPPSNPPAPMYGYGPPTTSPPRFPPMTYGPPPTTSPPRFPPVTYGPPPTTPARLPPMTYGPPMTTTPQPRLPPAPPPMTYGPPPATPPRLPPSPPPQTYGPPLVTTPRAPPVTLPPANPAPPAPPPPSPTYGLPQANPQVQANPSSYVAPPANPTVPANPPSLTYGAPQANPSVVSNPPAPPPIRPAAQNPGVFLLPLPRPQRPSKDKFSFFKKPKGKNTPQQPAVLAFGPFPLRNPGQTNAQPAQPSRDQQRNQFQNQRDQLQRQYLLNEQRLREQQLQIQDMNRLQLQIQVQEMQRQQLKDNLFKMLKKDKSKSSSDTKKMFYKGAMLLGAMSLLPFAAGRKRRDLSEFYPSSNSSVEISSNIPVTSMLGDILQKLKAQGLNELPESFLQDIEHSLPPPEAMHNPSCLSLSFCITMQSLEGTQYHHEFLKLYTLMFENDLPSPWVAQALTLAQQRETQQSAEHLAMCDRYVCPIYDSL